jgi:hypothetical protein
MNNQKRFFTYSTILASIIATACCRSRIDFTADQGNCTVTAMATSSIITCPNGTSSTLSNGVNGVDGLSAAISRSVADSSLCPAGGSIISFGLDKDKNGILGNNEVTQVALVCNGLSGVDGKAGSNAPPTPFSIVSLLAPCAANPMAPTALELLNPDLEIFERLQNGVIISSYSENINGYNTHFGVLSPGTYMSTGAVNCTFKLDVSGQITRQ